MKKSLNPLNQLKRKLEAAGIEAAKIKKFFALANPAISNNIFCADCFNKLYGAASKKNIFSAELPALICADCKDSLEAFLNE